MNKLAAIRDAVEEINKEALFGSLVPMAARFAPTLFRAAKSTVNLGRGALGATRAGLGAAKQTAGQGLAKLPGTGIKGTVASMAIPMLPNASGAASGPTKF